MLQHNRFMGIKEPDTRRHNILIPNAQLESGAISGGQPNVSCKRLSTHQMVAVLVGIVLTQPHQLLT